jgi:PucR family transcriptional regulator, purine catabolism regulatory protein
VDAARTGPLATWSTGGPPKRDANALRARGAQYAPRAPDARGPVPLWLSQLIADPSLGLEVVAGRAGVDQRGPIRWAHIADTPDPTPWLEGGEVVLTTGLGVKDSVELQRRLVTSLTDRGVVAIGFGVGVTLDEVPPAMLDACDEHALPLFTVPYEVPFLAVTRRVSHHTFEEHYATLRGALQLHRQVLAAVVAEGGVDGVLATVGRAMPGTALIALDFSGIELARHDPSGLAGELTPDRLWAALPHDRSRASVEVDTRTVTGASVRLGDEVEAVVIAVSEEPLLEHEELLFEQGLTGVSLELARGRSVREARRSRIDELLEEVAAGRSTGPLVERALERLEAPLPQPYRVLAVSAPEGVSHAALCTVIEDALLPLSRPLVGRLDGAVYAVVPDVTTAADQVVDAATRRGWAELVVGRSRAKRATDALRAALREAHVALLLDAEERVRDVEQLGLAGLLAGMRDDLGATDFVTQVLGPVIDHDERSATSLVDTLRAYLAHGCRPGAAADELCIHRHTLAYRLDRIRELTGRDPRSGDHLIEFGLALELLERAPVRTDADGALDGPGRGGGSG